MARRVAAGEDRRNPINSRIRDALRTRLEEAAQNAGRTLSHEIEERLEQSFRDADFQDFVFGNAKASRLFHYIASVLRSTKTSDGKDWNSDPALANVAGLAICNVLLSCSAVAFDAHGMLRANKDLERRVIYAAQLISNYTILSYGADFDPDTMKSREGAITPPEAVRRYIVDGEKI